MRPEDERYFERLESRLDEAFDVATAARNAGEDPVADVEIPVAKDMADRVENLLGIPGVAARVRELESRMSREEAALALAADFADGSVGEYETRDGKIEGAVRTAVALLTEGVVAAPIEGIDRVELATNDDGSEFVRVFYAGPIRSAGGTAQALSVLVADYTRSLLDVGAYTPRSDEIERYVEEVALYDAETGLQYSPTDAETRFITSNCPICVDGEATGVEEVSGYRDLERVNTNRSRGGMCLVLAEGIALKAPKIERYTSQLDEVDWPWLDDLIDGTVGKDESGDGGSEPGDGEPAADDGEGNDEASEHVGETGETGSSAAESAGVDIAIGDTSGDGPTEASAETPDGPARPKPASKYLRDLIAGRPVFSHPSRPGGFRLRYGRARNHGFATAGVHPATMHLVDDFLATGTQIKTERPGKAAGVVPVDSIEGPTVRLANGEVRRIDDPAEALEIRNGVERILDVGEYLVNVGEFVENNHPLAPASYTYEWWIQEFEETAGDVQALADDPRIDLESPTPGQAIGWAIEYDAPLHPRYTYLWHDVTVADFEALADAVEAGTVEDGLLCVERTPQLREAMESLLIEHVQTADELRIGEWQAFVRSLGFSVDGETLERTWSDLSPASRTWAGGTNAVAAVNEVAPFEIRERSPTRIGNRMGRPEKSETRELSPAVHTLFPIGEAGGAQRDVSAAASYAPELSSTPGVIEVEVGERYCAACDVKTFRCRCPECRNVTTAHFECHSCGRTATPDESGRVTCPRCEVDVSSTARRMIDVGELYHDALEAVGERENAFPILKGVKGLTSAEKTPEPMEKGILRAKHGVSMFKDGTIRYDMTDLPVTAVHPAELDVSVDQFRELGYHEDIDGEPLVHDDQLVELKVQDIVLSDGAAEHLLKIAAFVDDLLVQYYGLEPFYEVEERDELVGELVFGMAPHTSAAVVGRVIGFTNAAVGYAHPYFHASKRRNCDGDEDCIMLLLDGLLNFSRSYLPSSRGGRMDAPLVMSSRIDPAEIDDEAHNMDVVRQYPREFYEATLEMADPGEVAITLAEESVGTDREYTGFGHTHDTSNIALGPDLSAYKTLGSMMDKMDAQLELARKLRAVDQTDVAERVIEYHFLPDLIGNLRAFARQETRCHGCGKKYRRVPLSRTCRECGGDVGLTVHRGSVTKYMDAATRVAEQYDCREYTKQRLALLDETLESVFENDQDKPSTLAEFM